jgi:hypothetical protein
MFPSTPKNFACWLEASPGRRSRTEYVYLPVLIVKSLFS